jgi:hypothetical protein
MTDNAAVCIDNREDGIDFSIRGDDGIDDSIKRILGCDWLRLVSLGSSGQPLLPNKRVAW